MNKQRVIKCLDHLVNGVAYSILGFSSAYGLTQLEAVRYQLQTQSDIKGGVYASLGLVTALSLVQTGRKLRKAYIELVDQPQNL